MKTLTLFVIGVWIGMALSAQDQGPIPKISQQMAEYFSYYPIEKVYITTDKSHYKPGETIWFRAFVTTGNNMPAPKESNELFVKLYDNKGVTVLTEVFKIENGCTPGDLSLPKDLAKGNYSLAAYTLVHNSPEDISLTLLQINPEYSDHWIAEVQPKDSISTPGQKNELFVALNDISGDIQKNTPLRYQFMNGTEVIEKGKVKTDDKGKATLPFTMPAKTNGEPFIFELSDNKEEWKQEVFLSSTLDPLVIKFFPEGGSLITGTPSKIGFTAFNNWGIPVDVEGSVFDQDEKPVSLAKTFTKGLGLFTVANAGKQKYKLVLSEINGQNQSFELPEPNPDGLALSVVKNDTEFISANLIFADKQKHPIALLVTQGSNIYWAADMEINGMGRIKIPAENIPHGINQLSVFSNEGQILAQRIFFADKKQELKVAVLPAQSKLKAGENMKVKIRLTDESGLPLSGNMSISVSDKSRNDAAKSRIDEYLLIGAGLETPFSVISEAMKGKVNTALMDVYLIANRINNFDWVKIKQFKAENAAVSNAGTNVISGIITDKNGNKMNKAKVSLVNNKNMQLHTTTSNADGRFNFPNLNTGSTDDFSAKATDPEGKRELKVTFNKNLDDHISDFVANNARKFSFLKNEKFTSENYFNNNPDLFVKEPKPNKPNTVAYENQRKMLSTATSLLDVIKSIRPYRITNNQIVFAGSENSINFQGGALIVLDGQQLGTDVSVINSISPNDVDHIFVSTNAMEIQRYTGLNSVGLIEIFTKKAQLPESVPQTETKVNKYDGLFRIPNDFQVVEARQKNKISTTLLWIPNQKVNETGQFEFTVTAGKVISDFVIEVQGISGNGRPGSGKAEFSVVK
ncbi:MAG: MG2 domain-containing protein [Bacteroidota bacterium]|nr:hypothetical protein [Odoribacter sp.]MDP3643822.1 MG2 domain-containing protein [Bacteroidota bacterium]